MDDLNQKEVQHSQITEGCNWVPEYGAWMVEATPNRPYTGFSTDLLRVERNMRLRRRRILTVLRENEIAPTVSSFPLLGALGEDGSVPPVPVGGNITLSEYIGDGIINPHPRFGTLTTNIRQRRGSNVNIKVPLFRDHDTPEFTGFEAIQSGAMDGCCGSDAQQVSSSRGIFDFILFKPPQQQQSNLSRIAFFSSCGVMEKVMHAKNSMVETL
jgi:hypothetical protein